MLSLQHIQLKGLNLVQSEIPNIIQTNQNESWIKNSKIHDNVNHPVHILDKSGSFTASSFIPFCNFGGNMSVVGKKIDEFPIPVCRIFKKTALNRQVCYSIDMNEIKNDIDKTKVGLSIGLNLLLDYNEERQTSVHYNAVSSTKGPSAGEIFSVEKHGKPQREALIYLSTLGKHFQQRHAK